MFFYRLAAETVERTLDELNRILNKITHLQLKTEVSIDTTQLPPEAVDILRIVLNSQDDTIASRRATQEVAEYQMVGISSDILLDYLGKEIKKTHALDHFKHPIWKAWLAIKRASESRLSIFADEHDLDEDSLKRTYSINDLNPDLSLLLKKGPETKVTVSFGTRGLGDRDLISLNIITHYNSIDLLSWVTNGKIQSINDLQGATLALLHKGPHIETIDIALDSFLIRLNDRIFEFPRESWRRIRGNGGQLIHICKISDDFNDPS